ncbi:MAG TPA: VTT domain-containing protein [Candidatus Dormibacteraeota bacterium]|nr:VTT domain-containing protein [Candidatus Dormibacteraeota bacterium]
MGTNLSGVAIVCVLLFLEEAGLPIPVAPGEAALVGAGLLVASGAVPVWLMAPLAYLAVICGVLTGYAWAHRIGPKRVHAFAVRLHAGGPYDRAASRLRAATPLQVAASRLLPGLRVYTSLVAGAVGLKLRRFMIGVLPASALWVLAFMGLGLFVGAPVERLLGRFEAYGLRAAVVAVVVVVWVVAARRLPVVTPTSAARPRFVRWRVAAAFLLDLTVIGFVAGGLSLITGLAPGDPDEQVFAAGIFAILGLIYLMVARQTVGHTLGEALLDVHYNRTR